MPYSQAWLEADGSQHCILVVLGVLVVGTGESTVYLSDKGYSYNGVEFPAVINGNIGLNESIDINSAGASISYNDIELINNNGTYDSWLNPSQYIWKNRTVSVYICDRTWTCTNVADLLSQSRLILSGIIDGIDSRGRNSINFKIRNKFEYIDSPVTENKLGTYGTWAGGQTNQDTILPLVFGEVFNIEPLAVDPSTLQYKYHDGTNGGAAYEVVEIRDNGVPIYNNYVGSTITGGATINLSNGTFTLNQRPAGTITCSIMGTVKSVNLSTGAFTTTYTNNIANIIATLVTQFGKTSTRLTSSDLDLANLQAFAASNTQAVGILINDSTSILDACNQLASSIGAQVVFSSTGKLQLIKVGSGISGSISSITDSDIILNTLEYSNRVEPVASTTIGYCKNHTIQTGLLTGIPEAHKNMFATEYLTVTNTTAGIGTDYKLTVNPEQVNTCLIVTSDATAEASRRNTYFNSPRMVYKFTGTRKLLGLVLGQSVTITHNRFNLSGTTAQVISLSPDWERKIVEVEILV